MSEAKFTPGPWTAEWDDGDGPTGWPTISSPDAEIAGIEGFYGPTLEAAKANAVLCSAAPDLYEALADLAVWWENWMPDNAHSEGGYEALQTARAVLAKARGEAQS